MKLSAEKIERLITLVSKQPFLYDPNHKEYNFSVKKKTAWEIIAEELGEDEDIVIRKWRRLKYHYNLHKKQAKYTNAYASAFAWSPQINFLDKVLDAEKNQDNDKPHQNSYTPVNFVDGSSRSSTPTMPSRDNPEQTDKRDVTPTPQPPSEGDNPEVKDEIDFKKVITYFRDNNEKQLDGIDHLFLSYSDTIKKFPPEDQVAVKLEIAKLFSKTELDS